MNPSRTMRILAISGSLRAVSTNKSLLWAARLLAPASVEVSLWDSLAALPHFNPDLEGPGNEALEPEAVKTFRAQLREVDAVLISSPEYAHGVPGALKDALDWVVGSGELIGKPVGLLRTSASSIHAHAALTEILATMDSRVIADASGAIPILDRKLDEHGIAADPVLAESIRKALASLIAAVGE